jgi:hypothetical protein
MAKRNNTGMIFSAASGILLLALISAGFGFIVGDRKIWPSALIKETEHILRSFAANGEVVAVGRQHLAPQGASREPAAVHNAAAAIGEGHYALLGWDGPRGAYSVFLRDAAGKLVHAWPIDEMAISDKAENRQNGPHAMTVLADGSLVVSFDWLGLMARLDACGNALWSRDGFFHHSFSRAADGGVWTWYGKETAYGQIQTILKFDPMTGEDIASIDFNRDVVMRSPDSALIFSVLPDFVFTPDDQKPIDIFHPNDVEELLPDTAAAFAQFEAGDLMLSIRELDLLVIISPEGEIKWHKRGPWLKQHDPDFEPDGRISVYDNSRSRPRSTIMTIDPKTMKVENAILNFTGEFKSERRGKHQLLPNGNRLITIPEQGQALEIAPDGSVVVEFNNISSNNPDFNEDLVNVRWLPAGFFDKMPSCSK